MKNDLGNKKICKYCKSEISKTAQVCPICSKKQGIPSAVIAVGIILLFVGVWSVIIWLSISQQKDKELYVDDIKVPTPVPVIPKTEATPTVEAEEIVCEMDETALIGELEATMTGYEENTGDDWNKPGDGKRYLYIEFTFSNTSKNDISVTTIMSFKASVDGKSTGQSVRAMMSGGYENLDGTVKAGEEKTGFIAYEVPENWEEVELTFTPDLLNRNSSAKFKLVKE